MRLLEVVASTKPLSSLGHLRKISKNCSNFFADSLQLLSEVSHPYTRENFHYLFSVLHAVSAKKENDNEAAYLFQAFLLEAWIQ